MTDVFECKCNACGGMMEFSSKAQTMVCPYCGTTMEVEEYEKEIERRDNISISKTEESWEKGETDDIRIYICESCGGEIMADENTGASICPFCDNKVVMKGQFENDLKPDYIIPFKLDKKDAKQAYLNHLSDKIFLPKVFRRQNHIDEIKGVYVPFWLYSTDVNADFIFNAERLRSYKSGDTEYTEHSYYDVRRAGQISFDNIPEDASTKMDDTLMESVEPFNFEEAVPFKKAYLSGYLADRYDVDIEERKNRVIERIDKNTEDKFMETVQGYHSVNGVDRNIEIENMNCKYALYPVWILNTTWKDKKYVFAMNGQTGKIVGDLPMDKQLFRMFILKRVAIMTVIFSVLSFIYKMI